MMSAFFLLVSGVAFVNFLEILNEGPKNAIVSGK